MDEKQFTLTNERLGTSKSGMVEHGLEIISNKSIIPAGIRAESMNNHDIHNISQ